MDLYRQKNKTKKQQFSDERSLYRHHIIIHSKDAGKNPDKTISFVVTSEVRKSKIAYRFLGKI